MIMTVVDLECPKCHEKFFRFIENRENHWIETYLKKEQNKQAREFIKLEKQKAMTEYKKTDDYKIGTLLLSEKMLEQKIKRLNKKLTKVRTSMKYYQNKKKEAYLC